MRLYVDSQYISPYAMSAFVALQEKQLPFELVKVDLAAGVQHQPQYASASLTQRVPTLVDGQFTLAESSAIAEYLHEAYPGQPLYPRGVQQRARARQVQAWLRSDLMAIRQERSTEVVFHGQNNPPLSADAQRAATKLFAAATSLLSHGGQHLFDDWCIADADLALMLNRLVFNGDSVPKLLADYAARQWQRASIQQWVGHSRAARVAG